MKKEFKINFNPFSKSFLQQIQEQGLTCTDCEELENLEFYALKLHRMCMDQEIDQEYLYKQRQKIAKRLGHIVKENK